MDERSTDPALAEAARLWGVQPDYQSQEGAAVRSPDEAILAALRELGAPVESHAHLPAAVRAHRVEHWAELVEPVVVWWSGNARAGDGRAVEVRLLAGEATGAVECELTREDGATEEWSVPGVELEGLKAIEVEGREHVTGRIRLPADLPEGYHELTVRSGPRHARTRVVRAPRHAWTPERDGPPPREWGAFLPLYALRTRRSHGVADLTDLASLQAWTHDRGGTTVGTLPLLATFLSQPFDPSPYAPVSRLFWNELYLDPERAPGLDRAPEARRILESPEYRRESARLRDAPEVDHRAAMAHRRRVLGVLAREFAPVSAPLPVELAEYSGNRPEAVDYAAFRALGERQARSWREWPGHLRAGSVAERDYDEDALRYHLYVQWAMDRQLVAQGRGSGPDGPVASLYMDLPLGCHPDGFDVWRWRDLFADASAGAPPDAFFAGGQDWGFPPLHPRRARENGHAYWIASLRHLMRVAGMLRLDHVMGLHRLFWIPRGIPATDGVYVRYPADELYACLCLESHRHQTELVGEDLGTVPAEVRKCMDQHRLRRMYVVPFELDVEHARLPLPPPNSVASLGTHDTAPFRAFLDARDVAERVEAGQLAPEQRTAERDERYRWTEALARALDADAHHPDELVRVALERLAEGPARLVLVSLEDLWLETEAQNRPGTPSEENWRHKARYALEELDGLESAVAILAAVDGARRAAPAASSRRPRAWSSRT